MFCVYNASMIYFFFFFLCFSVILNTWLRSTWRSTTWGIGFEWFLPTRTGMFMNWDISTLPRMRARRKIEIIVFYVEASSIRGLFLFFWGTFIRGLSCSRASFYIFQHCFDLSTRRDCFLIFKVYFLLKILYC